MAGRKQHFIPQHFLKEFTTPDGNDKLWMHRRGLTQPVPVSRGDVAATRDFYSKPVTTGAPTLDDLITEYEQSLRPGVEEVRAVAAGQMLPAHLISEIIAHLTLRAAYLREFMDVGAVELVSSIDDLINHPSSTLSRIELPIHMVPSKIESMAIEQLEQHPLGRITNVTPKALVRLLYQVAREESDVLQQAMSTEFSAFLVRFQHQLEGMSRASHIQVLEKELVPNLRKSLLEKLYWKAVDYPSRDAVLPDCVAIAEDASGWGPYIVAEERSTTRVVIPLSSSKLAVGSVTQIWGDVVEIYSQAARDSCFSFYLKNKKEEVPQGYLDQLGGPVRAKIQNMTSSALHEAIGEFVRVARKDQQEVMVPITWADLAKENSFSYPVSLRDFGDKAYAESVAATLGAAVKSFAGFFPIHRLDGITFADDFAAALKELDRGAGVVRTIEASAGDDPNGVALPLAVRREDGIKTHLVLRGYIANDLISNDDGHRDDTISVICYCLGTVAFNALVEAKFPEALLAAHADPYEGWLYQYNDTLLTTYFSTSLLMPKPETLGFYADQAYEKLDRMIAATKDAHSRYQEEGDHERFFEMCATHVSNFMTALARYFAARATVIGPLQIDTLLDKRLSHLDLFKWSKLFDGDLAAFKSRLDGWAIFDHVYFVNRHFERLLFEVGVLPDQMNCGSLYIHASNEHRLFARL